MKKDQPENEAREVATPAVEAKPRLQRPQSKAKAAQRCLVLVVFSPTRLAYKYFKDRSKKPTGFAAIWPIAFLVVEAMLGLVLALTSPKLGWLPAAILGWFAASRIFEIAWAYYNDSMGSLRDDEKTTKLIPVQRIQFAMMSYVSLIFLWAFLWFALPLKSFKPCLAQFTDAKLLCILEVLSGLLVLVVAVASYLARLNAVKDNGP